jgi:hypothetical protein
LTTLRIARAAALALALFGVPEAKSAPANTLRELFMALNQCLLQAPTDTAGSEMTVVFSLKRDGSLLGKPRISHTKLLGDRDAQSRFAAAVLAAFDKCLPLKISAGLGGAIAGRPLSIRVISQGHETDI